MEETTRTRSFNSPTKEMKRKLPYFKYKCPALSPEYLPEIAVGVELSRSKSSPSNLSL